MGKKGSWFSAIKRAFSPNSKEKLDNESERSTKDKKKKGLRHGESNSFIPLFRKPSSIEKILEDAEREHKLIFRPPTPPEQPKTPTFVPHRNVSPRVPSPRIPSPRATSPRANSPPVTSPRVVQRRREAGYRPEPTLRNQHASATKIQATYRGYRERRSFRAIKGLVRLQGVVKGHRVKRQTMKAMKSMQLMVRVQSQIQSRRIGLIGNQTQYGNDKEVESVYGKWNASQASEAGNNEDWDDSLLTKEEVEARLQRKVDAVINRERAIAYSHQLGKNSPKSAQTAIQTGGFPRWWNWLERQHPPTNPPKTESVKTFQLTQPASVSHSKPESSSYNNNNHQQQQSGLSNMDNTPTPKSVQSRQNPTRTPSFNKTPHVITSANRPKSSRSRTSGASSPYKMPFKDDDSLMSCPPFSAPNYMTPTVSARAKSRASSNPKERFPRTPTMSETASQRRTSFPLTPGIGSSFRWNKGSFSNNRGSTSSPRVVDNIQSPRSIGNMSVDSTVSMPAGVGRKPFNRFV